MRKFIRIIVGVAMLSALAFAPTAASANHDHPNGSAYPWPTDGTKGTPGTENGWHEDIPVPYEGGTNPCVVDGFVTTRDDGTHPPAGPTFSHGHYTFFDTEMLCVGIGPLDVDADGGFDGPSPTAPTGYDANHGSSTPIAWSHCSEYSGTGSPSSDPEQCEASDGNTNNGDIEVVDETGTCSGVGWVHFIRYGPLVYAWGTVGACRFTATLVFVPVFGEPPPSTHTHTYTLQGAALVG